MIAVLDSSVLLTTLSVDQERRAAASDLIEKLLLSGHALAAPTLMTYEIANGLSGYLFRDTFSEDDIKAAAGRLAALPVILHPAPQTVELVETAQAIGRQSAYDAAYLHLSKALSAPLWTFDAKLLESARDAGFTVFAPDSPSDIETALLSIPGVHESIVEGMETPLADTETNPGW